ncbi:hypothetical protein BB561_005268 [Smittium simulii]|uniref:Glutathione synthetase n=1 Tax=Smittium simulii TaxID=133385 RepID=A0A2T9YB84_9FUNG|nr:hypothetical protein BB561_005268 [Smittium simulii]
MSPPHHATTLPADKARLDLLLHLSTSYLAANGVLIKPKLSTDNTNNPTWVSQANLIAPASLTPSPLPKECFYNAIRLQPVMNKLYRKLAQDSTFIHNTISSICNYDSFTANLYDIFKKSELLAKKQPISLDINRSDYLLHQEQGLNPQFKQVEFNTISISFSSLSAQVGHLHRFLQKRFDYKDTMPGQNITPDKLPQNESLTSIADGLASAFKAYASPKAVVLLVGQVGERNVFDQQLIELQLFERHGIPLIIRSLEQVIDQGILKSDGEKQILIVDGFEVAVAYYRAGYTPADYPTQKEWDARLMIETSYAIKSPSVAYQLVGTKKVQQVLFTPGIIEQYLTSKQEVEEIRSFFVDLFPLDQTENGIKAYESALLNPELYVLKPQREGGGFNTYGKDIPGMLETLGQEERQAYILMKLINAPTQHSVFLRNGEMEVVESISELGVYGIYVANNEEVLVNKAGGHLLRSKPSESNEGGVASGYAVLDSPYLVEE